VTEAAPVAGSGRPVVPSCRMTHRLIPYGDPCPSPAWREILPSNGKEIDLWGRPGSNVVPLRAVAAPDDLAERTFVEMLEGWRNQQLARNLAFATINAREAEVRRFVAEAGEYPWRWSPQLVDEWLGDQRAVRHLRQSTIRSKARDTSPPSRRRHFQPPRRCWRAAACPVARRPGRRRCCGGRWPPPSWLAVTALARRWRRWPAYLLGVPLVLVVLFMCFEQVARLFPASI
jgi:hypothetical protein